MPKRKKPQRRTPAVRIRTIPLQVLLSEDEHASLEAQMARTGRSASELVRALILAEPKRSDRAQKIQHSTPPPDPRQTTVTELLEAARRRS